MSSSSSPPWTRDEVRELKRAFKIVHTEHPTLSKSDKWKRVSAMMGGDRSKRECYEKYKELLEERAREKEEAKYRERKSSGEEWQDEGNYEMDHDDVEGVVHRRPSTASRRPASAARGSSSRGLPTGEREGGIGAEGMSRGGATATASSFSSSGKGLAGGLSSVRGADDITCPGTKQQPQQRRGDYTCGLDDDDHVLAKGLGGMAIQGSSPITSASTNRSSQFYAPAKETSPTSLGVASKSSSSSLPLSSHVNVPGHKGSAHMDLVIEDCDDLDIDYDADRKLPSSTNSSFRPTPASSGGVTNPYSSSHMASGGRGGQSTTSSSSFNPSSAEPITVDQALALRLLLFGDRNTSFNKAWLDQEFSFNSRPGLGFGLVQHKGGPCGVLASVQAFVLAQLLSRKGGGAVMEWQDPPVGGQREALVLTLAGMLWRAAVESKAAVLATPASGSGGGAISERTHGFKTDGLTERLRLSTYRDQAALEDAIRANLDSFTTRRAGGVVAFTYSLILSRGVDTVRADMDEAHGEKRVLIDRHGYAAQELVNLCLIGRAHSNVFDGENILDDNTGKTDDHICLRGIPIRGTVGFLTLFEAYGYFKVGTNYKESQVPIWVVCSESHYSVLFLPGAPSSLTSPQFELHYYDGLANQEEDIILTVDRHPAKAPPEKPDDRQLIPPLDFVVRTRWPGAGVTWNVDPIY